MQQLILILASAISISSAAESCAGKTVGGACWYLGAVGESCDTVCAKRGGYNPATRAFAGDTGTDANCKAVLNALGLAGEASGASCPGGGGCVFTYGSLNRRCTGKPTDAKSSESSTQRACACNR